MVRCLLVSAASGVAMWRWLEHRRAFLFLDARKSRYPRNPAITSVHEMLRPLAGVGFGILVLAVAWELTTRFLNSSPRQQAANELARETSAARHQLEAAEAALKAEAETRRRTEELARYPVGSAEWRHARFRHHVDDVRKHTGVGWQRRMWSDARTTKEREARSLMAQLRAEDRQLTADEELRRKNQALSRAEKAGGISNWRDAERFMGSWMRQWFTNVKLTSDGADGGIDIVGSGVVAQVKFESTKSGRPAVQRLKGAAGNNAALFFTSVFAGYTPQAVSWANDNDVCLFVFDLEGAVHPSNLSANELIAGHRARIEREKQERELKARRLQLGPMNHARLLRTAREWLTSELPTSVNDSVDLSAASPMHFHGSRFAAVVCFSPTNAVGRPRLEQLVTQADGRVPIFFVAVPKGLSAAAQSYADANGLAIFTIDVFNKVTPSNQRALAVVAGVALQRM
jgi:hypothetical protein